MIDDCLKCSHDLAVQEDKSGQLQLEMYSTRCLMQVFDFCSISSGELRASFIYALTPIELHEVLVTSEFLQQEAMYDLAVKRVADLINGKDHWEIMAALDMT
jgi:hypothetical protein